MPALRRERIPGLFRKISILGMLRLELGFGEGEGWWMRVLSHTLPEGLSSFIVAGLMASAFAFIKSQGLRIETPRLHLLLRVPRADPSRPSK